MRLTLLKIFKKKHDMQQAEFHVLLQCCQVSIPLMPRKTKRLGENTALQTILRSKRLMLTFQLWQTDKTSVQVTNMHGKFLVPYIFIQSKQIQLWALLSMKEKGRSGNNSHHLLQAHLGKRSILYNICVYMYMRLCMYIYIDTCIISTAYNRRIKDTVISDRTMSEFSLNAPLYRCAGDIRYALSERGSE